MHSAIYWLAVLLVSIVGTVLSDIVVDRLGVSLEVTTVVFGVLMALAFGAWYTAGDLVAGGMALGYMTAVVIFAAVLGATCAAYRMGANAVLTFCFAYVVTQPFGAATGDLIT